MCLSKEGVGRVEDASGQPGLVLGQLSAALGAVLQLSWVSGGPWARPGSLWGWLPALIFWALHCRKRPAVCSQAPAQPGLWFLSVSPLTRGAGWGLHWLCGVLSREICTIILIAFALPLG